MRFKHQDNAALLDQLLGRERQILLDGDIAALQGIVTEKERLIVALGASEQNPESLAVLRAKSSDNSRLLLSAARGIAAARKRLDERQKASENLATYDRSGQRTRHNQKSRSLERRA